MPRFLRLTLWSLGLLAIILGGAVLWIEAQLRPEPLGRRVQGLLADAKIKGEITRIEASLDGTFSAEGINLTLADGTSIVTATIKGEARLWSILTGTYALSRLEIKGLELDLSHPQKTAAPGPSASSVSVASTKLPAFALGPYSASGRIRLADGTLVRFSVSGDQLDSAGPADLRAGLAWPGFKVDNAETVPRGEVVLKAEFRRPLGAHGLSLKALCDDVENLDLQLVAKDTSPLATGSMTLTVKGAHNLPLNLAASPPTAVAAANKDKLLADITITDAGGRTAVKAHAMNIGEGIFAWATLAIDPTKFGILSNQLPDCQVTGRISGGNVGSESGSWSFGTPETGLNLVWANLAKHSPLLPRNARSAWNITFGVAQTPVGFTVSKLIAKGNGIELSAQPFSCPAGQLPADLSLNLSANDADLISLTPFLALVKLTPTAGTWTGEATISLVKGEPTINTVRTHEIKGLTLERDGKELLHLINAQFPLKSENGALKVAPFSVSSSLGTIARGELTFLPGKNGAWSADANVNIDIAELAAQPGWEDLPRDKLAGIRADVQAEASAAAGQSTIITATTAQITRGGAKLLNVKLRQPFPLGTAKPAGVLLEATAANLPLESVAALVPGLKISGILTRADLVAGFNAAGLFVRTEGAPLAFVNTSASWTGKQWVKDCDLSASLELTIGERSSVISLNKARLSSRGGTLAVGDISLGLGEAATTLKLEGDLGALAHQPFAGQLGVITGGKFQASAERKASGDISVTLDVTDVGLKLSEGRIKQARVTGKYTPQANGLTAEGSFRLVATNLSSGKFTLSQATTGPKTDWQAALAIDVIDIDDLLGLIPKSADEAPQADGSAPKPDRTPFWENQTGTAQLSIGKAKGYGVLAETILIRAEAEATGLRLSQVSGKVAGGTLSGRGLLAFKPTISQGPYALNATLALHQFELGNVLSSFPSVREIIQGRADASVIATSVSGTPSALLAKLQLDSTLTSKGGRLHAFGHKEGGTAAMANKAGDIGETLGGLALIAGVLTKNQEKGNKIAKVGAALSAVGKLQKALSDFNYDTVDLKVSRLASGTLKFDRVEIRNPQLNLQAKGGITISPGMGFADWPMVVNAQLRGAGEFAEYFNLLGFSSGTLQADGMTEGPLVNITGSLNNVKSDLIEKLNAAVDNVRSGSAYRESNPTVGNGSTRPPLPNTTPAPAENSAPAKKRNPLSDLLKELGR